MNNPDLYHDTNTQTLEDGILHLEEIKDSIKWSRGEKVLDLGSGPGNFTAKHLLNFLPEDATLVGGDISKEMINYANKKFKHTRLSFVEMDIESPNILDTCLKGSFTKIHSLYCFHWIEDTVKAIENMHSLLKPGGEIFLVFFAEHKVTKLYAEIGTSEPWKDYIKGKIYFTRYANSTVEDRKKRFTDELTQAGFIDVEINVKECICWFPSSEVYLSLVKSIDPYHNFIPNHLKREYDSYIEKMVVNEAITVQNEDGKAKVEYSLFIVRAKTSDCSL